MLPWPNPPHRRHRRLSQHRQHQHSRSTRLQVPGGQQPGARGVFRGGGADERVLPYCAQRDGRSRRQPSGEFTTRANFKVSHRLHRLHHRALPCRQERLARNQEIAHLPARHTQPQQRTQRLGQSLVVAAPAPHARTPRLGLHAFFHQRQQAGLQRSQHGHLRGGRVEQLKGVERSQRRGAPCQVCPRLEKPLGGVRVSQPR
mmetsp:Transcript_18509/g.58577  ORF Transcript_18509/g.58577 Transcript_18509/m.58577 type:complete len:202 (-) Transcript_18509:749-1354(-)